jgi:hypothetical protein
MTFYNKYNKYKNKYNAVKYLIGGKDEPKKNIDNPELNPELNPAQIHINQLHNIFDLFKKSFKRLFYVTHAVFEGKPEELDYIKLFETPEFRSILNSINLKIENMIYLFSILINDITLNISLYEPLINDFQDLLNELTKILKKLYAYIDKPDFNKQCLIYFNIIKQLLLQYQDDKLTFLITKLKERFN